MIDVAVNSHQGTIEFTIDEPIASANIRPLVERAERALDNMDNLKAVVFDAPKFPPWRDLSQFLSHFKSLQVRHKQIQRVAVITNSPAQSFAASLVSVFPVAIIDGFVPREKRRALHWVSQTADIDQAAAAPGLELHDSSGSPVPEGVPVMTEEGAFVELDEAVQAESGEEDDWFV